MADEPHKEPKMSQEAIEILGRSVGRTPKYLGKSITRGEYATKISDLSQQWGVGTTLWPFPGPRQDPIFQWGEYLGRFHKTSVSTRERFMPAPIWTRKSHGRH